MVRRTIEFYNLDVIISVGYRVKSKNGVAFRKWANSVLKEYLLRGYVVNGNRALVTNENYINLLNNVESIDSRLTNAYKGRRVLGNSGQIDLDDDRCRCPKSLIQNWTKRLIQHRSGLFGGLFLCLELADLHRKKVGQELNRRS